MIAELFWLVTQIVEPKLQDIQCRMNTVCNEQRIQTMYRNLWAQTGESEKFIPLVIVETDEINATTSKDRIALYTGLMNDVANDDELAAVLGHEIAHCVLGHLYMNPKKVTIEVIRYAEAQADKMGAVYMMKAGYNICVGRNIFLHWREASGDYLNGDHPDYSYRYSQLNIGCN